MGQNQISIIAPRSEPQRQQKDKPDDIERILQGLQIANGVLGIGVNFTTIQNHRAQNAAMQDERQGILTAKQSLDAQKGGLEEVAIGTPGASSYKIRQGDDATRETAFRIPQKVKEPKPVGNRVLTSRAADGTETHEIVPDVAGTKTTSAPLRRDTSVADQRTSDRADDRLKAARERAQVKVNQNVRDFDNQIVSTKEVEEIAQLGKTNPTAAGALGLKMARAAGEKGVISDADARQYGGSRALMDQIDRYVQRSLEGTLEHDDVKFASEFAQTMEAVAQRNRAAIMERNVKQFTANYGGDFTENYAAITGVDYEPPAKASKPATGDKPPSGTAIAAPNDAPEAPAAAVHPQANAAKAWATKNQNSQDPKTRAKAAEILNRLGGEAEVTDEAPVTRETNPLGNRYRGNRG